MRINAIEPTRSPNGKLRIRFEDDSSLLVYPSVIGDLGLYPGMELSQQELSNLRGSAARASARERAVRIISAGTVTEKELLHRLRAKGEQDSHAHAAVDWLKELRLLDDSRAAEQIVASGIARGYGEARLRQLLYEKGVPRELWQDALAVLPEPEEGIHAFLSKRFRGKHPDRAEQKRATEALLRRGYRWGDIRRAMERYGSCEDGYDYDYEG